jgi:hypothetical protein
METTFILKDVIYIVVGVASALGFYWKMVMSDKFEKTEEKTKEEFTNINAEINEVKIGISTINGKLDILINK